MRIITRFLLATLFVINTTNITAAPRETKRDEFERKIQLFHTQDTQNIECTERFKAAILLYYRNGYTAYNRSPKLSIHSIKNSIGKSTRLRSFRKTPDNLEKNLAELKSDMTKDNFAVLKLKGINQPDYYVILYYFQNNKYFAYNPCSSISEYLEKIDTQELVDRSLLPNMSYLKVREI